LSLTFKTYIEVEVRDKSGKLTYKRRYKAKSWLTQFIKILKGQFATRWGTTVGHGNTTVVDIVGSTRSIPNHSDSTRSYTTNISTLGDAGDEYQGIVVGKGTTPNSLNTYKLASPISHGTGAGQLSYGAMNVEEVTNPSGNTLSFRLIRTFTNQSGADITVYEIGLVAKFVDADGYGRPFLLARDVLPSPVTVANGATLTVRYIVSLTVS